MNSREIVGLYFWKSFKCISGRNVVRGMVFIRCCNFLDFVKRFYFFFILYGLLLYRMVFMNGICFWDCFYICIYGVCVS